MNSTCVIHATQQIYSLLCNRLDEVCKHGPADPRNMSGVKFGSAKYQQQQRLSSHVPVSVSEI